jgi:phosphate transport system protein
MVDHIVRAFTDELSSLTDEVMTMGGLAEAQLQDAVQALVRRDAVAAAEVVKRDLRLDEMQREIERRVLRMLALRKPVADDLRAVISSMKLAGELERVGDMAKSIARRSTKLTKTDEVQLSRSIERMCKSASQLLRAVLDAYSQRDAKAAINVWFQDESLDEHYNSIFRELITFMMEDPRTITTCTHLHFIAKNIERIGDHCTNMAEVVHFLVTGEDIVTSRPKANEEPGES